MSCPFTGDENNTLGLAEATIPGAAAGDQKSDSPSPKAFRRGGKDDKITRADEGWFGPGSVAWKVWLYPTAALQGFARAVTIEHLDPDLVAAVDASGQVYKRTPARYDRTMEYFVSWMTADSQTVIRMADILMKVHDRSYGVNPVTGNNYEANKPESQLWIHVTAWHSILYVYETFGPGKLSRDEENEYWSQMVTAAATQPIRQEDVPRTRGEVQKYLDDWREKLSASEAAIRNVDVILDGFVTIEPDLPKWLQKLGRPLLRTSIIATYPRWMRPMLGVKQSRLVDTLSIVAWKPIYKVLAAQPRLFLWLIKRICPRALRYYEPALLNIPAESPRVLSPEVSRRMYGNPLTPLEQREELLKKRQEGTGQKAYDHNHTDQILEFRAADAPETAEEALDSTKAYEVHKIG
ncbi:MAG: oxygenase MpaB family protein [Corynebacterium sp.]|uniref:oxygenase MpaB family protein n=1 Tax=unclassified Corynebacterium TaxID=2624378 RepID=UPI003F8FA6B2